ncbi:unnamed protein product, partial [marine sediment metagenome]
PVAEDVIAMNHELSRASLEARLRKEQLLGREMVESAQAKVSLNGGITAGTVETGRFQGFAADGATSDHRISHSQLASLRSLVSAKEYQSLP